MNNIKKVATYDQSIWYDNIRRAMLTSGELRRLRDDGVMGVTSNPTIFDKAISGSTDYDDTLLKLVEAGKDAHEIYEALVLEDIAAAADLFRPVYDQTGGLDGYISVEVRPTLAGDTQGTIAEAVRLFSTLGRPNIMIKVPATPEGIPAIESLIAQGVNINITLIFSLSQYEAVTEAYLSGLEKLAESGGDLRKVASVASFFVSRVDTAVDQVLDSLGETELLGEIAVANAKVVYARFQEIFNGQRWESLADRGATVQRPLWASTGTKNPAYSDTLYIDSLIGPNTVNTVPPATLEALMDHGHPAPNLTAGVGEAKARLARLSELGVDLESITQKLLEDGVASFSKSYQSLITSIMEKCEGLLGDQIDFETSLGEHQKKVAEALAVMDRDRVLPRIWEHDHTVWKPDPTEISNRLGWLNTAEVLLENLPSLEELQETLSGEGYTHALLLGMGGSSLAPEVFRKTFGVKEGFMDLTVLDSTDPGAVLAHAERLADVLEETVFIVATKSGGTVETLSFFKYFYNLVAKALGEARAGEHFIAITDPGSRLASLAEAYHFRATFFNDSNIGGRYSALSYFGMLPAALIGVDLGLLLNRALEVCSHCGGCNGGANSDNKCARLGAILGKLALSGRDKVTLVTSPEIASFGDWVEQLIAESTGKEGLGILPVVGETVAPPEVYGDDRLFVYMRLEGDHTYHGQLQALEDAGQPVLRLLLKDRYDLGGGFFLWEMATAVAGHLLGINPFDQPNVESAKVLAREMVAAYQQDGELPETSPVLDVDGIRVYGEVAGDAIDEILDGFLSPAQPGSYVALQAYVQPTPETDAALASLRDKLRAKTRLATTVGYGPRFLHSTGQLHKGDGGRGLFIQFSGDVLRDVDIPDKAGSSHSSISYGTLEQAQMLGDAQALRDAGRQVLRFHLGDDVSGGIDKITKFLV